MCKVKGLLVGAISKTQTRAGIGMGGVSVSMHAHSAVERDLGDTLII